MPAVTNVVMILNFEVISDKFNILRNCTTGNHAGNGIMKFCNYYFTVEGM
jgi:hypothetical protein